LIVELATDKGVVTSRATTLNQRDEPVQDCTHTTLYPLRATAA
jgi:acyl dehydratase